MKQKNVKQYKEIQKMTSNTHTHHPIRHPLIDRLDTWSCGFRPWEDDLQAPLFFQSGKQP